MVKTILINSVYPVLLLFIPIIISCSGEERISHVEFETKFVSNNPETSYLLDIYGRIDRAELKRADISHIPIEIVITSPNGNSYTDIQSLPVGISEGRDVGMWLDLKWSYRKGVSFPEEGRWIFLIKCESSIVKDLGITVKRHS